MIGKRQARVLAALRVYPLSYSYVAAEAGMLLPSTGYPGEEFYDLFGRCLTHMWVHVAHWGDGVRETEYALTDKGRAALAAWEAKQ